jgi:hypothetical protein
MRIGVLGTVRIVAIRVAKAAAESIRTGSIIDLD